MDQVECGSQVSNQISKNQAVLNGKQGKDIIGFPNQNITCYSTSKLRGDPLPDGNSSNPYSKNLTLSAATSGSSVNGFMMDYDGSGFVKILKADF